MPCLGFVLPAWKVKICCGRKGMYAMTYIILHRLVEENDWPTLALYIAYRPRII